MQNRLKDVQLSKAEQAALKEIEKDDIPELEKDFFETAEIRIGDRVIREGRPPLAIPPLNETSNQK